MSRLFVKRGVWTVKVMKNRRGPERWLHIKLPNRDASHGTLISYAANLETLRKEVGDLLDILDKLHFRLLEQEQQELAKEEVHET